MISKSAIFFKQIIARHVFLYHCLVLINLDHNFMPKVKYHRTCHERKSKRVCIFSTYDEDSVVQDYVMHCLSEINRYGFEVIFVSTSEGINEHDEKKVAEFSSNIVIRENEGYDFTSWKEGTKYISWDIAETILFLNDSIIFPLYDFSDELEAMVRSGTDFWGLVDSQSNGHFINSFFWLFNKHIVESEWFVKYCNGIPVESKKFYVEKYEAKIIDELQSNGFTYDTFIKCENIYEKRGFKDFKDYTHYRLFWDILYTDFNSPFLKKNILTRGNKEHLIYTDKVVNLVQEKWEIKRQIINFLDRKSRDTENDINGLIDCVSDWFSACRFKVIHIYGDSFAARFLSFVSGARIVRLIAAGKELNLVEVNHEGTGSFLGNLPPSKVDCLVIASFNNHEQIYSELSEVFSKRTKLASLEEVTSLKPGYLDYFENLALNFKYCLARRDISKDSCSIVVNGAHEEIFRFCADEGTVAQVESHDEEFFFRLDLGRAKFVYR